MKQKKPFKPNYIPKEKLNIFSDNDYFLYSKKFFNTLNIDFFKAKSINLTSNRSKLGAFNPDININGISNTKDILVDMNLNTNLEKVFLNKCFNLDKEEDENLDLKDEILSILKEKEDEKPVSKVTSFYMRKTTLISTLHNQLEKNVNFKTALPNSKSNSNMNLIKVNKVHNEENINLFKSADTSEFFKNPEVKQVYPILPFIEFGNQTSCLLNFHEQDLLKYFNSSILNSYSKQETEIINSLGQNNVEKREKLMGLYSTTKNQKDTGFQIVNNVVAKPLNELDLFNTVLLFKSKTSDLVFYLPLKEMFQIKKHINLFKSAEDDEDLKSKTIKARTTLSNKFDMKYIEDENKYFTSLSFLGKKKANKTDISDLIAKFKQNLDEVEVKDKSISRSRDKIEVNDLALKEEDVEPKKIEEEFNEEDLFE